MNVCIFKGRLTADPEMKVTKPNGHEVCNFVLAIPDGYGEDATVEFVNFTAWRGVAKFISYCKKGYEIVVQSKYSHQEYTDKNGNKVRRENFIVLQAEAVSSPPAPKDATASEQETFVSYERGNRAETFTPAKPKREVQYESKMTAADYAIINESTDDLPF